MDLSKRWLLDYVDLDVSDKEFASEMTMSGSKVESYAHEGADLSNIVVGKILSLERHPDSDHLWVCSVDAGGEAPVQIVTGAQNLTVGDYVPAALDDSYVAGKKHIKKGKLRGVESSGMLCSLSELGLTVHDFPYAIEDGIFVLGEDCERTPGTDIHTAIGLDDTVTEFEITSNRPDCLSVVGLAREAAATFGKELKLKAPEVKFAAGGDVNDELKVRIDVPDTCYRYIGAVVKNIKIEPSPRWMRERLRASGVRPINNIVDITNYVMLEYGQPMHAFDIKYIKDRQIVVRRASKGESITTLEGVTHELEDDMMVIADVEAPVAVAGVMGGEYSGIMDDTTTIVFESACFNGYSVRSTAKRLGLRTESSSRYEKELDPEGSRLSMLRALELVELLGAGDVVKGLIDVFPTPKTKPAVAFDPDWTNNFIGIDVSADEQKKILEKIGFTIDGENNIRTPYFRVDIEHKADVAEEIARFYGYENIKDRALSGNAEGFLTDTQKFERKMSNALLAMGLSEIYTFSFISPKNYEKIRLPEEKRRSVVISNPLGEDTSVMRCTILPSMMDILAKNYANRNLSASLFEIAREYIPTEQGKLPLELNKIAIGMYGAKTDYFTLKGVIEKLLALSGVKEYDIEAVTDDPTFHPGRTAQILVNGKRLAILGEIHPDVAANYGIKVKPYAAVVDFDYLCEVKNETIVYKPMPRFPAATRDIAVVAPRMTPVLLLEKAIKGAAGRYLEKLELFDVYTGEQIASDKKSVAFSLTLRSDERTLTDEEADAAMKRIVKAVSVLGAELRS
ncbi:MAG: phenylalanine--tRNA ligase subunit beta [Clostridia bacterium]|nr:phenylalanine--tRNA ligase subunit beta [Clostridia bacterium]